MSFKMNDDRKPDKREKTERKWRYGPVRKLHSEYRNVRPEKVEEIQAVWDSPIFKTNNQRLVYLFRHCKNIEYGYTIREFAHARFPKKMIFDPKDENKFVNREINEGYAFRALWMMFNRFRKDIDNHEVMLAALFRKLETGETRDHKYESLSPSTSLLRSAFKLTS